MYFIVLYCIGDSGPDEDTGSYEDPGPYKNFEFFDDP